MVDQAFDVAGYLNRIGLEERPTPSLRSLQAIAWAHARTIPFENLDVLLGRPPKLDLTSLQAKLVRQKRGGYCFEQNLLLRAALRALGFDATGMIARVVRGAAADTPTVATHMVVRVTLPDGVFLVDVGFGNLTPTSPLALQADIEQPTLHETMRLLPVGSELVLQARLGERWENLWRLCAQEVVDADYEVANWFTATHPESPFVANMIAARPAEDGTRNTFLNGIVAHRLPDGTVHRSKAPDETAIAEVLRGTFGLEPSAGDLTSALDLLGRRGRHGQPLQSFS